MFKYLKKTVLPLILSCSLAIAPAAAAAVCGDSDKDGKLTANDAALLLTYVLNSQSEVISPDILPYLDVTADGILASDDCAAILAKVLDSSFKFALEDVITSGGELVTSGTTLVVVPPESTTYTTQTTTEATTQTTTEATTQTTTEATTQTTTEATTQTTAETTTEATTQAAEAPEYGININGVVYYIGQSESDLPQPSYKGTGAESLLAYSYCEDYSHYTRIGVKNGKVVSIVTFDKDAAYDSNAIGSPVDASSVGADPYMYMVSYKTTKKVMVELAYDSHNSDMLYSIILTSPDYLPGPYNYTHETIGEMQRQITDMTNAYRALYGLKPYAYNTQLAAVAQAHAEDMAQNSYFSHTDQEGLKVKGRIEKAGILYSSCGENINAGYDTAEGAVNAWINSEGHRINLLDGAQENAFTHIGVGVAYNANDSEGWYTRFVQNFISAAK